MAESVGRACGKVILLGEHAVVHGVPAIAVGIDRGARAVARPSADSDSWLVVPEWNVRVRAGDDTRDLGRALAAVLDASARSQPVVVEAVSELPPGAGLGCSAALGVAVARAVDPDAVAPAIETRAMAWERVFHGNPSGVDAAVSAHGGCVLFERGSPVTPLPVKGALHLAIGHSGVASSTRSMVELVARQLEKRPEVVQKAFSGIRALVANARVAIEAHELASLGQLMDMNQMILAGLMLSTPEIEQLCSLARGAGALGAKLTGAGGGGCVVALAPNAAGAERIVEAFRGASFQAFAARVGGHETERGASSTRAHGVAP